MWGFIGSLRNDFDRFEERGKCLTGTFHYHEEVVRKRRKNVRLTPLVDTLIEVDDEMTKDKFKLDNFSPWLTLYSRLCRNKCLHTARFHSNLSFSANWYLNDTEIRHHSQNLVQAYIDDLEDSLVEELIQFRSLLISSAEMFDNNVTCSNELNM